MRRAVDPPGAGTIGAVGDETPSTTALGPNAWLVDEMYEQYLADPSSVSESWRDFFADYKREVDHAPAATPAAATPAAATPAAAAPATNGGGAAAAPAAGGGGRGGPPPPPTTAITASLGLRPR
jgi:2-oxoglutarate decarboxylase